MERVLLAPSSHQESSPEENLPIIEEREPNDHPGWAQSLPPRTVARGYINKPRKYQGKLYPDRDVYLFTVPGPGKKVIWAKLKGVPHIDLYIEVYRRKGPERIYSQNVTGSGQDEIIPNLTLSPGKYFFKFGQRWVGSDFRSDTDHPYELVWSMKDAAPGTEAEPNDARYQANQLVPGATTSSFIGSPRDRDVYLLPEGRILRLDITLPEGLPAVLSLWPAKGKHFSWRKILGPGEKYTIRRLRVTRMFSYAAVSAWHGKYDLSRRYRLSIALEPDTAGYETEPNDDPRTANPLPNTGTVRGYMVSPEDEDVFLLHFTEPSLLTVRFTASNTWVPRIHLGSLVRTGQNILIHRRYVPKGQMYLKVSSRKGSDPEEPYVLELSAIKAGPGDEREPNDTRNRAMPIRVGEPIHGYITPKKDVDYYRFVLGGTIHSPPIVQARLTGTKGANPILRLIDAWGNVVVEDSNGVYTGMRKVTTPLHPGLTYYLEVRDRDGLHESPDAPYELRLIRIKNHARLPR